MLKGVLKIRKNTESIGKGGWWVQSVSSLCVPLKGALEIRKNIGVWTKAGTTSLQKGKMILMVLHLLRFFLPPAT
jgi:hypothetical protein